MLYVMLYVFIFVLHQNNATSTKRAMISWEWDVPTLQDVSVNEIVTPIFRRQNKLPTPLPNTLPPNQAKLLMKSVFLNA